jgi:glucose-6-phosphate isomerase
MQPFGVDVDLIEGIMTAPDRIAATKASDMRGYYQDAAALERLIESGDPLLYEVFEKRLPLEPGHVMFCISKLQPGRVGQECFMTKGHYHETAGAAELYLCLRGRGYLLMKTAEGQSALEPMYRGRLVYVPPYWAHRSINSGQEPLISLCAYPADAGHNYGDIKTEGFPKRVLLRGGGEVIVSQAAG